MSSRTDVDKIDFSLHSHRSFWSVLFCSTQHAARHGLLSFWLLQTCRGERPIIYGATCTKHDSQTCTTIQLPLARQTPLRVASTFTRCATGGWKSSMSSMHNHSTTWYMTVGRASDAVVVSHCTKRDGRPYTTRIARRRRRGREVQGTLHGALRALLLRPWFTLGARV